MSSIDQMAKMNSMSRDEYIRHILINAFEVGVEILSQDESEGKMLSIRANGFELSIRPVEE